MQIFFFLTPVGISGGEQMIILGIIHALTMSFWSILSREIIRESDLMSLDLTRLQIQILRDIKSCLKNVIL